MTERGRIAMNPGIRQLVRRLLPRIAYCTVGLTPIGAFAQEVLQEIVVTAQKREQNLQDVGISIAAFSEDQLKDMGVGSMDQLGYTVPGVNIDRKSTRLNSSH